MRKQGVPSLIFTALLLLVVWNDTCLNLEALLISHVPSTTPSSRLSLSSSAPPPPSSSADDGNDTSDGGEGNLPGWKPDLSSPPSIKGAPNKLDVYGEEELVNLLQVHRQLYPMTSSSSNNNNLPKEEDENSERSSFMGIHDMVMSTVKELEVVERVQEKEALMMNESSPDAPLPSWVPKSVVERMKNIHAIASDVDGTITGSDQSVHPKTEAAIRRAVEASYSPIHQLKFFFPATGKSKAGAMASLPPEVASLLSQGPGVYIQGLYCVTNGDKVIFEKKLSTTAVAAAEKLVADSGTSVIAYDGDTLYTNVLTETVRELHDIYKEPLSKEIPVLKEYSDSFHKLLICDNDVEKLKGVRTALEQLAEEHDCVVTQAIPTMLELLPSGCSKAMGVQKLCEELGIDPTTELLAVGDAENDVGMLQMAAIGCAVDNANALAKDAADVVLPLSSTNGGAGLAFEVIGGV